jgi:hypothetical protein
MFFLHRIGCRERLYIRVAVNLLAQKREQGLQTGKAVPFVGTLVDLVEGDL